MRGTLLSALLAATVLGSGCSTNSSDERLRTALGVPKSQPLTEALVAERFKALVPVGTAEPAIAETVKAAIVRNDPLSSYSAVPAQNIAVVRIEYDPSTLDLVKSQWIITLHLDPSQKLQSVSAKRQLTGL